MINLLPPIYKEELERERILRLVNIIGSLAIFFFVALGLTLLSVSFFTQGMVTSQEIMVSHEKERLISPQIKSLNKKMSLFQEEVSKINSFYNKNLVFSSVIIQIANALPEGVYLRNLSFSESKSGDFRVVVSGFAPDRNTLFSLKKNIEKNKTFQDLDFPAANWEKSKDINFSLSFSIKI